jgi:ABC-2 type transport system permease protein
MKILAFSLRNTKEILRDKINILFGLGFPIIILMLLSFVQKNVPAPMFQLQQLTPGIIVFGFSFFSLFSGMLIAKDRTSSLFMRLFTSPLKAYHFIVSYYIPFIPLAILQAIITFIVAIFLGLDFTFNIFGVLLVSIPAAVLFLSLGILFGTTLNDKQVGGVCGALLTNFSAWLSDTWFQVDLAGATFAAIAKALPFYHAVEAGRFALAGEYAHVFPDLWWVLGYATLFTIIAILIFRSKMNYD